MREEILMVKNAFHNSSLDANLKNAFLSEYRKNIIKSQSRLIAENQKDINMAIENQKGDAFIDRLKLTPARIKGLIESLDSLIGLVDPVYKIEKEYFLKNGLMVRKVRAPLGVIGVIFEARPNVAVDCISLCIKSGNGIVLRGSREAVNSVRIFVELAKKSLKAVGIDENLVFNLEGDSRDLTKEMLGMEGVIDVIIPRGGEGLKKFVLENAKMPVIASAGGNCHIYISKYADLFKAIEVIVNAKTQRPSVCNALETILIDTQIMHFATTIIEVLTYENVEVRASKKILSSLTNKLRLKCKLVGEDEAYKEYEDMKVKIYEVDGLASAISHINTYGTHHSDSILSENEEEQKIFAKMVDSAAVYINSSTRFTDGFELGLGAEIGISTQKLHVRGPIGLEELTSLKYVIYGKGHIRK